MTKSAPLSYRIQPTSDGWAWATLDPQGHPCEAGLASTRALAAACVVRCLARNAGAGPRKAA